MRRIVLRRRPVGEPREDDFELITTTRLSPENREAVRVRYGLDRSPGEQYLSWFGAVLTGDLGTSFLYKEPVATVMSRALPPTVLLAPRPRFQTGLGPRCRCFAHGSPMFSLPQFC